ncbi:MAG TPA: PHP domain-containing protein [Bryobacteraceae bacterium]|jgi:predicted metal-dependent phosphoesterase TrpH|nr:PHP domain-containing protein [Bryobacteraceae bacterium]
MIDLHTHTNESDGTCTPLELVDRALAIGLEALAISDHDTFAGYDQAAGPALSYGLDLVCGIELSARLDGNGLKRGTVHLLGYFLHQPPAAEFRTWLGELQAARRERNVRLLAKLRSLGVEIELAEVERIGRTLTGRPHFARVLIQKGYAANWEEAFRKYLDESAPGFVEREAPDVPTGIQRIISGGGLPVLAHPVRLGIRNPASEESLIGKLRDAGLRGIEVYHSDHSVSDQVRYLEIARKFALSVTGGSDFHGDIKPGVALGTGVSGGLNIPGSILEELRKV